MKITATHIGHIATSTVSIDQEGLVLGNTSKGVFIRLPGDGITFISPEQFRGPLTINVPGSHAALQQIPNHTPVEISSGNLKFPAAGIEVSTERAIIWQPDPIDKQLPTLPNRTQRLRASTDKVLATQGNDGTTSLLPYVIGDQSINHSNFTTHSTLYSRIIQLTDQMRRQNSLPPPGSLLSLLGAGKGLTPSGDDFLLGLILSFNRWEKILRPGQGLQELNRQVVEAAYKKTSTLSANLIECAARGYADERLLNALDWLVSGSSQSPDPIDSLLDWGSSSGGDVFVGFAVALSVLGDAN